MMPSYHVVVDGDDVYDAMLMIPGSGGFCHDAMLHWLRHHLTMFKPQIPCHSSGVSQPIWIGSRQTNTQTIMYFNSQAFEANAPSSGGTYKTCYVNLIYIIKQSLMNFRRTYEIKWRLSELITKYSPILYWVHNKIELILIITVMNKLISIWKIKLFILSTDCGMISSFAEVSVHFPAAG